MFGLGIAEIAIILGIALLVVGPEKLPDAARSIARMMAQFRKGSDELRRDFYNSLYPPSPPTLPKHSVHELEVEKGEECGDEPASSCEDAATINSSDDDDDEPVEQGSSPLSESERSKGSK